MICHIGNHTQVCLQQSFEFTQFTVSTIQGSLYMSAGNIETPSRVKFTLNAGVSTNLLH